MYDVSAVAVRAALYCRSGGAAEPIQRNTPVEAPVGLSYGGRPHTVLMATPDDLADLARGFTVTEGVAAPEEIADIRIEEREEGWLADLTLRGDVRARARPRTLEGRSSCGLCGVQRLKDVVRPLPPVESSATFSLAAVRRALESLEARQDLGRLTRATHAAAFADATGEIRLVREDVGRHNALDKLAGALFAAGEPVDQGFVVVTSRCSFEMVEKAVRMGAPMIVAVSAPTDLAVRRAEAAGLTLVALARADAQLVFAGGERLAGQAA
jgi:FdhD protein